MPLLSTADLAQIKADVNNVVIDTSINTILKYRQYTSGSTINYDIDKQVFSDVYTDWSGVSAIKGVVTQNEIQKGIELGDAKFVFMQSSVSNTLTTSDLIVESGNTYNLKAIKSDPLGIAYVIFGEAA